MTIHLPEVSTFVGGPRHGEPVPKVTDGRQLIIVPVYAVPTLGLLADIFDPIASLSMTQHRYEYRLLQTGPRTAPVYVGAWVHAGTC